MAFSAHQNFGSFNTIPTQGTPGNGYIPPPALSYPGPDHGGQPVQRSWNIPCISESEAREAFIEYASSKCCYSSKPAREMVFQDLQAFNTYRYRLETFTESRSLEWRTKPFTGKIEVPVVTADLPWNVPVAAPMMFEDTTREIMMPHTTSIKECSACRASGRIPCKQCCGRTREQCQWCHGRGVFVNDTCRDCSGSGLTANLCRDCSGMGAVNCNDCSGNGRLMTYNALIVKWQNNIFEHMAHQRNDFPAKLFQAVTGQKLFVDEQLMVHPVINFPERTINEASRNAVERHRTQFTSTARILRQRQTVEHIPLTRVEYRWREASFSFYVYGNEHKVYAENYPQKCCCTII